MGGSLESRCVGHVYGADGAVPYLVASSWHFTLFHEEDARSNNPQFSLYRQYGKKSVTTQKCSFCELRKRVGCENCQNLLVSAGKVCQLMLHS